MSRVRGSITSVCLALFVAACGSGTGGSPGTGGSGSGGTSGGQNGGTTSSQNGGSTSSQNGGTSGSDNGGSTSSDNGGSTSSQNGGTTSSPSGGAGGKSNGGTTSTPNGGTTNNPQGGASGSANGGTTSIPSGGTSANPNGGVAGGGSGGKATGGNPAGGTNGGTGGVTSNGGSQAGGTQGSGGASSAGGSAAPSTVLITSANGAFWKTGSATDSTGNATITVNDTSVAQTWEGFGGAFNEKGWKYLTDAGQSVQDQAMQLLFGSDGCKFAWGRIPIGASDYALARYTDDEVSSGTDANMDHFSIDQDKKYLIPYIQAAQKVKSDIRFWGSPWTPPTWMKTGPFTATTDDSGTTSSNFDSGNMKSDSATLTAYAQYLVKWVQAFKDQGINVEVVAPQNEPNYVLHYPSCHWDTSTFVTFVGTYLGPAISKAGLSLKVMDGTLSNSGSTADLDVGQKVLQDSTAKGYCGAIGVQWGMSDQGPVNTLKGLAGSMSIWLSETKCGGTMGSTAPAPNDFSYAHDTWGYITGAIKNGLTGYNAWNMVLDPGGLGIDDHRKWPQNALLVVSSGALTVTPVYYVYRHISQFVDPGAKVVGTTGGDSIAFKNPDGSLVAVMYNSSGAGTYTVSIGGKKLQFAIPGSAWATLKVKP